MGERNTVVTAYATYRQLQQYCCHPLLCSAELARYLYPTTDIEICTNW